MHICLPTLARRIRLGTSKHLRTGIGGIFPSRHYGSRSQRRFYSLRRLLREIKRATAPDLTHHPEILSRVACLDTAELRVAQCVENVLLRVTPLRQAEIRPLPVA